MNAKTYTVSDGTLWLTLEVAEEGGYNVTCPGDPALITQANTLEEAFENAYDARDLLLRVRAEMTQAYVRTRTQTISSGLAATADNPTGSVASPTTS